ACGEKSGAPRLWPTWWDEAAELFAQLQERPQHQRDNFKQATQSNQCSKREASKKRLWKNGQHEKVNRKSNQDRGKKTRRTECQDQSPGEKKQRKNICEV